jgi:hypothetical protein
MKKIKTSLLAVQTLNKRFAFEQLVPVVLLSFLTWYFFYQQNLTLIYNDAMSHLNISRMVFDNIQPGLAQLGGVWLPISHVLPLLLIWNDWAWHSGFAGSFFSMLSYIVSVLAISKTVLLVTKSRVAGILAGFVFAVNLNMLYLQSTPMTEPLYVGLFSLSAYLFTRWITAKKNNQYLMILGMLGFFQVLTRYDGWFVVFIEALLISGYEFFVRKSSIYEVFGKFILFSVPVAFGVGMWIMWNILIFGDPLFFAFGPYSAHAQQTVIGNSGQLITKHNIMLSTKAYYYVVLFNIGKYVMALSLYGTVALFMMRRISVSRMKRLFILLFFLSPILFNVLALYLGFSIVGFPGLNPDLAAGAEEKWFNVRYGILALPLVAFLAGIFSYWKKIAVVIVVLVVILQSYLTFTDGIVTIIDGKTGASSFDATAISEEIEKRVEPGDKIIMSIYSFNPVAFKSKIRLNQIIHEGVHKHWNEALEMPEKNAEWIVMANTSGDLVYARMVDENDSRFLAHYKLVFTGNGASIYQRKIN